MKNFCKNQVEGIDETKKCFNNSLNNLSLMLTGTMKISQMLESIFNLITNFYLKYFLLKMIFLRKRIFDL